MNSIDYGIPDEENYRFLFSITSTKLLKDIVTYKIDPYLLAARELENRGHKVTRFGNCAEVD